VISWIAIWIGLFAAGMLIALLSDRENRRRNAPLAVLMAAVLGVVGYIVGYR
jgi:hypothetical protein